MQLIELFSGIGSQSKALKNLKIEHSSIACEIDKKIHFVYESIHGTTPNLGDITKLKSLPECDLLTYSFPCQDISILGNRRGFEKNSGTRSSLLWEVERLLQGCKRLPKNLVLENVKNLVSPKNKANFDSWLKALEDFGYKNSWKILNAEDFGLPQKRERVFVVSSLDSEFKFPEFSHRRTLGEVMEEDTQVKKQFGDSLYFKCDKMAVRIHKTINNTQSTNSTNRIYGQNGSTHALTTQGTHPGNFGAVLYSSQLSDNLVFREKARNMTIDQLRTHDFGFDIETLRLMSPKESMMLMGFSDEDYEKSRIQMKSKKMKETFFYKVAGNSIAVPVLEAIFKNLFM
jgi:DNA (cytosine-5)-methyltransferase 1